MTQTERLDFLIRRLLCERQPGWEGIIPGGLDEKKRLFRSLVNLRPPSAMDEAFLRVQDAYLRAEAAVRGVVDAQDIPATQGNLALWRGDITRLRADAIVNAANSALLGCFIPCHGCIDNAIHTGAGIQLRLECDAIMKERGRAEPPGGAILTRAYNLPSRYVIHTVGPVITGRVTQGDCGLLAACYRSCLCLAAERGLFSIVFCCISTGEFHFPQERAAQIAVATVKAFLREEDFQMKVIFNVFTERDEAIYRRLLTGDFEAETGA